MNAEEELKALRAERDALRAALVRIEGITGAAWSAGRDTSPLEIHDIARAALSQPAAEKGGGVKFTWEHAEEEKAACETCAYFGTSAPCGRCSRSEKGGGK